MIKSMTGYGRAESTLNGSRLTLEIRSVNNRFTDFGIRLPRAFASLEPEVKKFLQKRIARGSVSLTATYNGGEAPDLPELDLRSADHFYKLLNTLRKRYRIKDPVELEDICHFSEIFRSRQAPLSQGKAWSGLQVCLKKALDDFDRMRIREGSALAADLRKNIAELKKSLSSIEKLAPLRIRQFRDKFAQRLKKISQGTALDPQRLMQEAAVYADRCDISEECVRFASHIKAFEEYLDTSQPVGRRLDFLLQEINREANTIGSKANDDKISQLVVRIKENLEKMREQAQNVE
ncbi:MAG: YicC family protein [Candidatus Edwardsbacteria bacterium RIFOXYD12_FULL_50_11]|uniref:YicC family protein n=1 Tax=Candidatus Edwardsbacteria bacterium GWF2_54_11 TaxID=1817851 RepID=A0A1F5QZE1_9BACT|nr:MAG: YicC family protein [Candidatus Edwardsbacteria bacterium RifOxyC12_full_54_24]OGF07193.1 MAG: YicC family protein [Candidatus Edwardsbacteria bacterium GWF2_54_11]OGF08582.1 MAG: YicC family protein [Candidatus Edwardsbacteria bacterium RifOxyA12_full_54_48]OGF11354.1 MAG: YicC family protein [Candidatus Edwardsbacteria bacterium GWE2_54_12]OGF16831.1 MAG: YicC family protein [Candidatus Edwardsbacteria bacterium RIFOXYD12_FULL_50_11]OGJ18040.1 MAG: YicC family protein [Candidatus Edw